jgi:hypothetical protein
MSQEVVNSYNIFIDSERNLSSNSNGNRIRLPLSQTPISCAENQFLRLTLQSFSMYKSWTNINSNNSTFRIQQTQSFPAGTNVPLIDKVANLPHLNYANLFDLATNFGTQLASELNVHTGVALATPALTLITPENTTTIAGTTDNIISFTINFASAHGMTSNPIIQFKVQDGDIFEILGGNRIRDFTDTTTPSVDCDATTNPTQVRVQCYYNAQLSSQQNIYLRTTTNTTNIQTSSFNSGNTDTPNINMMENSRILGKIIIDDEFATFTSGTQMEYFLNLTSKSLTFLDLFITDSHGRDIPSTTRGTGNAQSTLGNRSFECVVKLDVVQYLGLQNNMLQTKGIDYKVPARFGTEPLNYFEYGENSYKDNLELKMKNMKSR